VENTYKYKLCDAVFLALTISLSIMAFNRTYNNSLTDELHAPLLADYEISATQNQLNTRPYNWVGVVGPDLVSRYSFYLL
jgi:hypothetical protein